MIALLLAACAQQPPAEVVVAVPDPRPDSLLLARHPELVIDLQGPGGTVSPNQAFGNRSMSGAMRHGIHLPAPSAATWELTVPLSGKLQFDASLPRSAAAQGSDGARLVLEIEEGTRRETSSWDLQPGDWESVERDLSAWQGHTVRLRLRTEPGASAGHDDVFVGEPAVYTPKSNPQHTVLVLVDTLRADRLGVYGCERPTSPHIDEWAQGARVFTQARTVAPWTLPAVRGALSGRLPDLWNDAPNLPELLGRGGVVPIAYVTNHFLSPSFGMDAGWSWHFYVKELAGPRLVRSVTDALKTQADRDAVVLMQFMDTHLPYADSHAGLWEGDAPAGLPRDFRRPHLLEQRRTLDDRGLKALDRYMSDRYDQAVLGVDDALAPLLAALDDNDVLILFSDHGEELGDHGGFEHGHALYEELVHVPLVVKAPQLEPGRSPVPASLLDLMPTVLELAGVEVPDGLAGRSLLHPVQPDRAVGFGFVLHGGDGWGAVRSGEKSILHDGHELAFDLASDPAERNPKGDVDAPAIAEALGRPVAPVWRFSTPEALEVRPRSVRFGGDIQQVWLGTEPPPVPPPTVERGDHTATVSAGSGLNGRFPREVFIRATGVPTLEVDGVAAHGTSAPGWSLDRVRAPLPPEGAVQEHVVDPQTVEALRALGYVQ